MNSIQTAGKGKKNQPKGEVKSTARKPKKRGSRKGFTTGACSAAAARAATLGLINGQVPAEIESQLPNGQLVKFKITQGVVSNGIAHAVVIKDAGDDPDVTDKAELTADVKFLPEVVGQVVIKGGEGVGVVTMGGLGLEVNGPAINPKPKKNIEDNVRQRITYPLGRFSHALPKITLL